MKTAQTPDVAELVRSVHLGPLDVTSWGHLASVYELHRCGEPQAKSAQSLLDVCISALNAVATPVCAVGRQGRLLFANAAAEALMRRGRWIRKEQGFLAAHGHRDCARSLMVALERLDAGMSSTVLLRDNRSGQQAVMTLTPLLLRSPQEAAALVWLITTETDSIPICDFARLFALTRAEQSLLTHLVEGARLGDAAKSLRISIHTARNQLKSVLSKTGRHSQSQLLTLVIRLAALRPPTCDL